MEIKVGIAYEGWERLRAKDREQYRLRNKRVYVHCVPGLSFWEGAMLAWWRFWDLTQTDLVVVNGDDASWIEAEEVRCEGMIRQQDGFHLARVCWRAFGKEQGRALYEALRGVNYQELGE